MKSGKVKLYKWKYNNNVVVVEYYFSNKSGSSNTLLYLHGGSVSFRSSYPLLRKLSERFTVYAPSIPGAGLSSNIPAGWKYDDYLKLLRDFIQDRNLTDVILCGHSMGGALALLLMSRFPDLFRKGVVCAPAGIEQGSSIRSIIVVAKNHIRHVLKGPRYLREDTLINLKYHLFDLFKVSKYFSKIDIVSELEQIKIPTLILWGRRDSIIGYKNADLLSSKISDSKLRTFDAGHDFIITEKEKVVDIIKKFAKD
jgi:2-hydroxy-6-oxonona-2,4-dienedioate hydrolase